jgi:hypothetical protein
MRYNRGSLNDTLNIAGKTSVNQIKFVYATAFGYKIDNKKPPFSQDYYIVEKGKVELKTVEFK